jgi:Kef-type K+ transport system membrane component KefB
VDPILFARLLASIALILVAAKAGEHLAVRAGQPAVLGELVVGVVIGNLPLIGFSGLTFLRTDESLDMLAHLGAILLLFQVGLESTVGQMRTVGLSAFLVGTLGVLGPFALGWAVGALLLPDAGSYTHAFLGAALTATSIGITARVLKDLGKSHTDEARIILGAAVVDDVQGLLILTIVTGAVAAANLGQAVSYGSIGLLVGSAVVFLVGSVVLGVYLSPRLFSLASRLEARGALLAAGLAFCFAMAWAAHQVELAPIVGAFAAGLVLEDAHSRDFVNRGERSLEQLIEPLSSFLTPIFFVVMGVRTNLGVFAQPGVLTLAAALTLAAIAGKQLCGLGAVGGKYDRLSIGVAMIPRGEVGLIFANIGLGLVIGGQPVVTQGVFSAIVAMIIATTIITPPALKWSFARQPRP